MFQQRVGEMLSGLVRPPDEFIRKYGSDFDIVFCAVAAPATGCLHCVGEFLVNVPEKCIEILFNKRIVETTPQLLL